MQKPKTSATKGKQKQISTLTTVMAQFDIQTQVNKMVMRAFDSLMRSNKQAFDFIKQGQHKFTKFQQRLSKAQTYYQNIQSNINSKIELTDHMNKRLQEFSTEFWQGMRDNNTDVIIVTKRLDQMGVEKKALENRLAECEKGLKKLQTLQLNLNDKVNDEVTKIYSTIHQTDTHVSTKFQQYHHQLQQLAHSITISRSLLQSKSTLLTQLMQDLQLYKHDRPEIQNQLNKLFEEVSQRAFKLEVAEVRGYVDSKIVEEAERVKGMWMRVETMVKVEERERKRAEEKLGEVVKGNKQQGEIRIKEVEEQMAKRIQLVVDQLQSTKQSTQSSLQSLSIQISTLSTLYHKQVPQLMTKTSQLKLSIDSLTKDTRAASNQIKQAFSNIESINELIESIIAQNKQRKEQMNSLKSSSVNQGNVEQQVQVLFEKINILGQQVNKLEKETIENIVTSIQTNNKQALSNHDQLTLTITQLTQQLQNTTQTHTYSLSQLSSTLHSLISQTTTSLQSQLLTSESTSRNLIENKISSIQKQLNQLDQIQQQIRKFKEVFKNQLQQNDKVNASVAEKMQRVMGMFTKVKSDISVKFQQITGEMQRKGVEIRANTSDLEAIKKYLSLVSECVNVLMAAEIFGKGNNSSNSNTPNNNNNKDTSLLSNQPLTTTLNPDTKSQHPQPNPSKSPPSSKAGFYKPTNFNKRSSTGEGN